MTCHRPGRRAAGLAGDTMVFPAQDISLAANLRRIATLVRDWPGERLDDAGCLRAVNTGASATPVFWCFNAAEEFLALGRQLGPGQPLAGMRSLNQVMDRTPATEHALDDLAGHYADALLRRFGRAPCIIGGNCQAAAIAYRVATRLIAAGVAVQRLVTLDAEVRFPFPGHVRLLFGSESQAYNPFLAATPDPARPPERNWRFAYRSSDWRIVDGPHGTYFTPGHVPSLARAILAPGPPPLPDPAPVDVRWTVSSVDEGDVHLSANPPAGWDGRGDLAVLPVWRRNGGGLIRIPGDRWIVPLAAGAAWHCTLPRPAEPVPHKVTPVLCMLDRGPLGWPRALCVG